MGAARNGSDPARRAEGVAGTLGRSSASSPSDRCSTPLSCRPRVCSSSPSVLVSASTLINGNAGAGTEEGRSRWLGAGGGSEEGREESDGPSLASEDFLDRPLVESREDLGMANNFPGAAEGKLTTAARPDHVTPVDFMTARFPRRGYFDHENSCMNGGFSDQESYQLTWTRCTQPRPPRPTSPKKIAESSTVGAASRPVASSSANS